MRNKLVITVAPQKDICPKGKTYPINAIVIKDKKIRIPENRNMNTNDAPLE